MLDFACGFGRHSLEFAKRGYDVTGIDITPACIDYANEQAKKENLNAKFICQDIRTITFDKEFDVVLNMADGSGVSCKMATDYTGIQVKQMLFEELDDRNQYDGIWACASVLHLSREKLPNIFHKMHQALKTNGIIYTSFKYGTFEGERNGRYFTDFTEVMFEKFAKQISGLQIEKMWITGDVREGRGDERWLNILLRKTDVC